VARARMEKLGLAAFFPLGQGAFGCDAEDRVDLIDIARKRAGDWPRGQTVAVGDTEADVAGARRAGIHVIGFGPDPALAAADAVVHSMADLPRALAALEAPAS
jgi:phosphoglycolate phosphatase-like HAD superfamily hydrolase